MARSTPKAIVLCTEAGAHKDTTFLMEKTDFRYGKGYHHLFDVKQIVRVKGRMPRVITPDNHTFKVFPDWSVSEETV